MKIISVVSEIAPFSYVGGLARGTLFLGQALQDLGHEVRVFTPLHATVLDFLQQQRITISDLTQEKISLPNHWFETTHPSASIVSFSETQKNLATYFLDYPDYFSQRSRVYDYADDYRRFYLFSVAFLEWLLHQKKNGGWMPDVLHCHDWHSGYVIDLLKRNPRYAELRDCKVLFTIHNFRYQNILKLRYLASTEQDDGAAQLATTNDSVLKKQNALLRGILYADWINTVSPTHAKEVQKPEFGYNLAAVLHKNKHKLSGILNGLNYTEFDPATQPEIVEKYDLSHWQSGKSKNKRVAQRLFGLPVDSSKILLAYVGRMTSQKGLELLVSGLTRIMRQHEQVQFVALGDGEDHYCDLLWSLAQKHPNRVSVKLYHDTTLPKQIFAGADMVLVPSNYEPGGIVVLEAMRYGAVPIVRSTGGLRDAIKSFALDEKNGTGFVFDAKSPAALVKVMNQAIALYGKSKKWSQIVHNALQYRQTWRQSAEQYDLLLKQLTTR
jgi:starch synthase